MHYPPIFQHYLEALNYYLWLSELKTAEKNAILTTVKKQMDDFMQESSTPSEENMKRMLRELGDPEQIVKHQTKNTSNNDSFTKSIKRFFSNMPLILMFGSIITPSFIQGLQKEAYHELWPHVLSLVFFYFVSLGTLFYYRYDRKVLRELLRYFALSFMLIYVMALGFETQFQHLHWKLIVIPAVLLLLVQLPIQWLYTRYALKVFE